MMLRAMMMLAVFVLTVAIFSLSLHPGRAAFAVGDGPC